jgi:low affinity Fe/Cu permease
MKRKGFFNRLAVWAAKAAGSPATFLIALLIVVGWAASGPLFGFADTWQLVINTGTTIITFLMVFLIQSSQNRDTEAMQIKLDELLFVMEHANNRLLDLEQMDEKDLDEIRQRYLDKAEAARRELARGDETGIDAEVGCDPDKPA